MTTTRARGVAVLALVLVAGCARGDAGEASADASPPVEAGPHSEHEASGAEGAVRSPLRARSASGVDVTLRPEAGLPLEAGPHRFTVDLDADGADPLPVSVDVVSPTMPMHGVRRYTARHVEGQRYVVDTELPMEGSWAVYVNLDAGADAAAFEFEVGPSTSGEGHRHDAGMPTG